MTAVQKIENLYADYIEQFHVQNRKRKPGQGILGIGAGPGDLPCHRQFIDSLEALMTELAGGETDSREAREALEFVFREQAQLQSEAPSVYWTLLAVQGLGIKLIELLSPEDAATLYEAYKSAYPRLKRMPAQEQVLKALKKRT